ncbi:MAG: hypothetical protein LBB21_01500 [Holosporaceae bacterium]|nr:hypothetical protein [Holosporaceae bacterium]
MDFNRVKSLANVKRIRTESKEVLNYGGIPIDQEKLRQRRPPPRLAQQKIHDFFNTMHGNWDKIACTAKNRSLHLENVVILV